METKIIQEKENIVTLQLTIPAKEAESAYNSAVSRIAQHININGFRKGKAPKSVVERHVGVDRIAQEALEIMLPKYLNQAIYDNKLDVITQPALTDYNFEYGKDAEVTVVVETRPEVKLGEYKGLNLKVEIAPEDKSAHDNALNAFLKQNSSLELVLDRPSCETDIVVFDFDGTCNGEPIKGGSAKAYTLDLGNSNFIPGFAEQLVGHNIKEEFNIDVTFPQDYHDEKLKGQPAVFAIKLNEIKQRVMPELTDEFVKKVSRFSTVDELKADINDYITKQREGLKKSSAEDAVFKSVNESTEIEVPSSMVNREIDALKDDYRQKLSYQGLDWNKFIETQGGEDKFSEALAKEAEMRIKNSLIIDKISKEEKINVEQSDFTQRLTQLSSVYGLTPDQLVKQFGNNPNFISSLSQQIVNDKVRDFLVENNNFDYVEVDSKEKVEA